MGLSEFTETMLPVFLAIFLGVVAIIVLVVKQILYHADEKEHARVELSDVQWFFESRRREFQVRFGRALEMNDRTGNEKEFKRLVNEIYLEEARNEDMLGKVKRALEHL